MSFMHEWCDAKRRGELPEQAWARLKQRPLTEAEQRGIAFELEEEAKTGKDWVTRHREAEELRRTHNERAQVDAWLATASERPGAEGARAAWRQPRISRPSTRQAPHLAQTPSPAETIGRVDFAVLDQGPPPARRWVVNEWLPRGAVTALFGRGGHGKSLLAQQLAISVGNGRLWLDLATEAGPVLGLFCEDDADELLRRGADIFTAQLLEPAQHSVGLHLDARAGKANTLMSFGLDHTGVPAPLFVELRAQCAKLKPVLVILDNIAQMFAGLENARAEVTEFCNALTGIAREFDCAVLLLGHLAKAEGSEFSGSTAWDAAVRSRLLLERQDDGTTVLRKLKANYSALDELRLQYQSGQFAVLPSNKELPPETLEVAEQTIREALRTLTARQVSASHIATANNFLLKTMKNEHLNGALGEPVLRVALARMLDTGQLVPNARMPWKNTSRHPVQGLALAEGA